jgi:1,4-dihydroxy-2-naphthoyl-CoA synthase
MELPFGSEYAVDTIRQSEAAPAGDPVFETLEVRKEGAVLFADIAAPPMNLLGPVLVRDLVSLIQQAEANNDLKVLVFRSTDPDYFISHVDVTKIKEYREEAAKLTGEASIALMFRHLSASRLFTIAQIKGRVRAAGSEFVLACDMRFAARETAIFAQPEPAFGVVPGGGGVQHLARLMGRGRALEVMLTAQDYDAEVPVVRGQNVPANAVLVRKGRRKRSERSPMPRCRPRRPRSRCSSGTWPRPSCGHPSTASSA